MDKEKKTDSKTTLGSKSMLAGQLITCGVFLAVIFGFGAAYIFGSDRDFSDMENRQLSQKPEFSAESLKSGQFTAGIEDYMSDQIAFKDELVTLKTAADRAQGRTLLNGVYFGRDGYYLQDFQLDEDRLRSNIGCLNDFAAAVKGQAECTLMAAPNGVYIMRDWLPEPNQTDDQGEAMALIAGELDGIALADPTSLLESSLHQAPSQLYYRTDHHWTDTGALMGYKALMRTLGEEESGAHFSYTRLKDFYGTLYSKAPMWGAPSDEVHLLTQDEPNKITVSYTVQSGDHTVPEDCEDADGVPTRGGLFDMSKAQDKDKYAVIMGGNFGMVDITSEGAVSDEHVLILKDSYANAMLPYLCAQYGHITMVDLRYYHLQEKSVSELVTEGDIRKVIMLYNVDFLNSDTNFVWLD